MATFLAELTNVFTVWSLFFMFIGVFLGCTVGAIPGLSGSMLIALSVPLTYYMDSVHAMRMLVSMYVGAISGGLISATLLRVPGTPSAVVTTFDGFPLARSGNPGRAIGVGVYASFFGGLVSWLFLVLLAPLLARVALRFSSWEFFALVLMALVLIAALGSGTFVKAIISGFLGLLLATPGLDPIDSTKRLTFGFTQVTGGLGLLPVLIGMFGISQMITDTVELEKRVERVPLKFKGMFLTLKQLKSHSVNLIRSSVIGTWIGILPGIGGVLGSIPAYGAARNASKEPEKFGHGSEEGIVASEAANNATINGALIPMITLGIPGSVITAILMGALILHGYTPGPMLFGKSPDIVFSIISTALVANVFMFVVMLGFGMVIARLTDLPKSFLVTAILVFCVIGTFGLNNRIFDVWLMFILGLIGFGLEKADVPLGPFIIGFVLSPIAESKLRSALMSSGGSFLPLITRPISLVFTLVAAATLVYALYQELVVPARAQFKHRRGDTS